MNEWTAEKSSYVSLISLSNALIYVLFGLPDCKHFYTHLYKHQFMTMQRNFSFPNVSFLCFMHSLMCESFFGCECRSTRFLYKLNWNGFVKRRTFCVSILNGKCECALENSSPYYFLCLMASSIFVCVGNAT